MLRVSVRYPELLELWIYPLRYFISPRLEFEKWGAALLRGAYIFYIFVFTRY